MKPTAIKKIKSNISKKKDHVNKFREKVWKQGGRRKKKIPICTVYENKDGLKKCPGGSKN